MSEAILFSSSVRLVTKGLRQAMNQQPPVGPLMEFFAFMAPSGFPKDVLWQWSDRLPAPFDSMTPETLETLFDYLDSHGLIIHSRTDIHLFGPVLGEIRQGIRAGRTRENIERAGHFLLATFPPKGGPTVELYVLNRLAWHARVMAEHALKFGAKEIAMALMHWLDRSGRKLIGPWPDRAINCHQSALHLSQRILGRNHPLTIIRLNNLGETWRRLKEPTQSEFCLLGALSLLKKSQKRHPHLIANVLGNLGLLRFDQGRMVDASGHFDQALSMAKTTRGLDDPLVFLCVNSLAKIMSNQENFLGDVHLLQHALEVHHQKGRAAGHPNVAILLNNLGLILNRSGEKEKARKSMEQALALFQQFLPSDHAQLVQLQKNIRHI